MSYAQVQQTPARKPPGTFPQTPAPPPRQPAFRAQPSAPSQPSPHQVAASAIAAAQPSEVERARRTINDLLSRDASFPDLDNYVTQGVSSDYDLPFPKNEEARAPYEKIRMYDIPDRIFEQYNVAQTSTLMGLFAELNQAWISIDNALYLWDYTNPNPELVGFEEQDHTITAVKLVVPRAGVFVPEITHVLVVATTEDIILLGVAATRAANGIVSVSLYQTRMSVHLGRQRVTVIAGSNETGRIFFGGPDDNDVHELTYHQEERWFASRCGNVNHTSGGYTHLLPKWIGSGSANECVEDIVIDDSRKLLYTLSSQSAIRTFHFETPTTLTQVIEKRRQECLQDISHMGMTTPLLDTKMRVISISPVSAQESSRIHIMATTTTGCRLFLSATRGYGYMGGQGAPRSMQVQHVKFPPPENVGAGYMVNYENEQPLNTQSKELTYTRSALRYPPGFFLAFVNTTANGRDHLFLAAPDSGRIAARAHDQLSQGSRYYEQGMWSELGSRTEDVGLVTNSFTAADQPLGFGNELAVQLDQPATEFAILTNTGIHTFRRRRFIDIFAAAIRSSSSEQGPEGEVRRFIRRYGRSETAAAALAVACGQATSGSGTDSRPAVILDPETLELARKCFIDHGGAPVVNDNALLDSRSQTAADQVRPSGRHDAIALYISRNVRSIWKAKVILPEIVDGLIQIGSTVSITKLKAIQDRLLRLADFLEKNKSFIDGLAGPESLQRAGNQREEIALQGEHQALHALQKLMTSVIEGISFVSMLFDERVHEIFTSLEEPIRQRLRDLSYESLFAADEGRDLAKVLVKAIVNRNIANGSNVDTVADALRRRCGSFCSAEDVIIFKAQEQIKKASELGANSDTSRNLLNESLRLLRQVAGSLSFDNLQTAVEQYVDLQFYAGAIQLCLTVADQSDRGNKALDWIKDGKPVNDPRSAAFDARKRCYDLVHQILQAVDQAFERDTDHFSERFSLLATKRNEAYALVNNSTDEAFHYDLYDWFIAQGWTDRLLTVESAYIVSYLVQLSSQRPEHADLLWRFYAGSEQYFQAAEVQLSLAKSDFGFTLAKRIEYLSRAKANASTNTPGIGRQQRQVLAHEISELLEVANIQDDLLQRLKGDERIPAHRKQEVLRSLDGRVIGLSEQHALADPAGYFDILLLIYQAADHRNPAHMQAAWQSLLESEHRKIEQMGDQAGERPYEAIVTAVRSLAHRLNLSETTFPPQILIPMLEKYAFEYQRGVGSPNWVMDLFIDVGIPYDTILSVLEGMLYNDEVPFRGQNRRIIACHMLYVIKQWYRDCVRRNERLFGGEDIATNVNNILMTLTRNGLNQTETQEVTELRRKIERGLR